ncbi:hypothetical protein CBR_g22851 [Chara braunii]|uniref:Uncharacterized protein n=1 Tax=Chara braunii TaxID=69332 RepID=A0A388L2V0_CHABU|nr:hypothetical protein CBR_g22851 [Chara braunii]|eukprot:GBG76635.1 hypothetical protein CBR_g22851 [Chara braunii]
MEEAGRCGHNHKEEEAEEQRCLAARLQLEDAEAAKKAADQQPRIHRDALFEIEGDIEEAVGGWGVPFEAEDATDAVRGIAAAFTHVTYLVATCTAQQDDILCEDTLVKQQAQLIANLLDRVHRLEQQPAAATPARPSNLEVDMGVVKDTVKQQHATNQQLDQQIRAAAASPASSSNTVVAAIRVASVHVQRERHQPTCVHLPPVGWRVSSIA